MNVAWRVLVALGILLILGAFNYDITVAVAGQRVHNIDLQGRQQMMLILGCALFLGGIGVFAVLKLKETPADAQKQKAALQAQKRATAEAIAKVDEKLVKFDKKVSSDLAWLKPGGDHAIGRLAAGILVGTFWYAVGGTFAQEIGAFTLCAVAMALAFSRGHAKLAVSRLLLANIALTVPLYVYVMVAQTDFSKPDGASHALLVTGILGGIASVSIVLLFVLRPSHRKTVPPARRPVMPK